MPFEFVRGRFSIRLVLRYITVIVNSGLITVDGRLLTKRTSSNRSFLPSNRLGPSVTQAIRENRNRFRVVSRKTRTTARAPMTIM